MNTSPTATKPQRSKYIVVAVLLTSLLASCGYPSSESSGPLGQPGQVDQVELDAAVVERAAAIGTVLTRDEQIALVNAIQELVAECMIELGWDFVPRAASVDDLFWDFTMERHELWLFDDAIGAQLTGYGIAEIPERLTDQETTNPIDISSLSADQVEAMTFDLFGDAANRVEIKTLDGGFSSLPASGCLGEVRWTVYGDIAEYLWVRDLRTTLVGQVWDQALSEPTLKASLDIWRECMTAEGFREPDPDASFEAALRQDDPNGSIGKALALADARCKLASGLSDTFATAYISSTDRVLIEEADSLSRARDFERRAIQRAKDLVQSSD